MNTQKKILKKLRKRKNKYEGIMNYQQQQMAYFQWRLFNLKSLSVTTAPAHHHRPAVSAPVDVCVCARMCVCGY